MMTQEMAASLLLEIKNLRADFAELKKLMPLSGVRARSKESYWLVGSEAAIELRSCGVRSAGHLRRLRTEGVFVKGEARNVSTGERPTWEYDVPKCREAIERYKQGRASI